MYSELITKPCTPVGSDHRVSLETEHDGLGDGAEGGQGPGQGQQQPGEPRGGAVQDREHRGAEPGQGSFGQQTSGARLQNTCQSISP